MRLHRPGVVVTRGDPLELRSDPKYGGLFAHTPASAKVKVTRSSGALKIVVEDFISPTILERLKAQDGVVAAKITDWRQMVDTNYSGDVVNICLVRRAGQRGRFRQRRL